MKHRYLPTAAAAALLKFIEYEQGTFYAAQSLKVEVVGCTGVMSMDSTAIQDLELIYDARTFKPQTSLFGAVNNTKTSAGGTRTKVKVLVMLTAFRSQDVENDHLPAPN